MNKRTRYFMVGSATVVVLGLCTGLVAFYSGGLSLMSPARGPGELAYLPADSAIVGYANVRDVMQSEFRQKMIQVIPSGEGRAEFLRETGIDIERDIDTVVASLRTGASKTDAVALVRGRFNDGQIEGLIRQHGGTVEQYQGVRMVVANPAQMASPDMPHDMTGAHDAMAVAFLESGLLAVGSIEAVKRAIDAKASGQNATTNAELMKHINDVQGGQSAWVVGRFDALQQSELPAEIKQHLPAVQWFALTTHVNGGVTGSLRAETADDVAAEDLRDVVRGGLAMGRLVMGQDQRIRMLLDSLQMSGTGKTVSLSFAVSPEMVDALAGIAALGVSPSAPDGK